MNLLVRAFPVLEGKAEALKALAQQMHGTREDEAAAFYRRHGVARESWHLQRTVAGTWILIVVTQIPDQPVAVSAASYQAGQESFDRWFKDRVRECTGIDPDREPRGPESECIYDSAGSEREGLFTPTP